MFHHLTGAEVDEAQDAADYLLAHQEQLRLDQHTRIKLDTLRADLKAEQEERRRIARS
jgi:hypothetical protein